MSFKNKKGFIYYYFFICLILLITLLAYLLIYMPDLNINFIYFLALVTFILSFLLIYIKIGLGFSFIYFLYFGLSHLGVPMALLFDKEALRKFREYGPGADWIYSEYTQYAILLSCIGIISFVLVSILLSKSKKTITKDSFLNLDKVGPKEIYYTGIFIIVLSTAYLFANIITGNLVLSTYGEFRDGMEELSFYAWMLFGLATGLSFTTASGNRKMIVLAFLIYSVPSIILMLSGNRGEVLFPIAGALSVLFLRGFRVNYKYIIIGALCFFIVLPSIFQLRHVDPSNLNITENVEIRATDPFVEIGHALRPYIVTIGWIDKGEEYAYGGTYYLPVQRMIGNLPLLEKEPLEGNRLFVQQRTPRLGYSVIAEAYFNFGKLGVIFIPMLIAAFFVFLGDRANNYWKLAFTGAFLATMINNVRNSFIFVPGQTTVILALILLAYFIYQYRNKNK